ncbi:phospholipase A2 group XV isoform X2 [Aplysia californica]|uniref:Phospholipase A2 group XV isoform X2 n=1 Tax=Aplysia californica TaxID=6500 RepID=A0ABM0JIW8_APLCA|nr:phospholipase A2 group XV isoform X2 [Aplysia californica]
MKATFIFLSIFIVCCVAGPRYPVILVPGDGGSQLEAKLNKTTAPHYLCQKHTSSYESIWLNLEELLPEVIDCFVDNMRLLYNPITRKTSNNEGVDIRVPQFGNTSSVEWLDAYSHFSSLQYFFPIVKDLVSLGYVRGKSVRGAPFDFRKAPNELGEFYENYKKLIEETYRINNNSKVALVAHSMGNPVTLYFLNKQPQEWKDQYIQSFITIAGVWGGAVKTLRLMSSGDDLGVVIVNPLKVRPEQRAMPSTAFLMPTDQFWQPSEVLVQTEKRNYTVMDYKDFFNDMNYTDGYNLRLDTEKLIHEVTPPGVPVHCLHGLGVHTPAALVFPPGGFPDTYPKTVVGDGDGTVNKRSLLGCLRWSGKQKYPVKHKVFKGAEHMSILSLPEISKYIVSVITGKR